MTLTYEQLTPAIRKALWQALHETSDAEAANRTPERCMVDAMLALGYLPPEVVAYRIREAERRGATSLVHWVSAIPDMRAERWAEAGMVRCDRLFPPMSDPLAAEPPDLELSTGRWYRESDGWWWQRGVLGSEHHGPECKTADDAKKAASWLETHGEGR